MRATGLAVATLAVALGVPPGAALAGGKDVCVDVSDQYTGRNCGTADSVQVDVKNDCGVTVKGALIFKQASGDPLRIAVTLNSGDRQTIWVCHGTGDVTKDFDAAER